MSHLALLTECSVVDEPRIYSFAEFATQRAPRTIAADERARVEFRNRCCPICNRVTVESIELNNGNLGRNGRMVPGTGTLVGFSCNACGHEWPA
ncbi:hypothetical protein [Planctomicrobium piriforme]|uniref:Uncharacterized protein n=1 Tax=Planctomicrobium piriforme TaxID=1576369 RepID=A0A1I3MJG7_9PLAN|nr:hypothetical protein [Planctomicrobium piriforme]SFI97061.1 hypothetical protein SAMN05421753_11424 [Planctomicrobium piriforme]